jgi:N-acetylmuramoyl-L-alanine amidase
MTNPEELALVVSDHYQNQVVQGIVNAVEQYFNEY